MLACQHLEAKCDLQRGRRMMARCFSHSNSQTLNCPPVSVISRQGNKSDFPVVQWRGGAAAGQLGSRRSGFFRFSFWSCFACGPP